MLVTRKAVSVTTVRVREDGKPLTIKDRLWVSRWSIIVQTITYGVIMGMMYWWLDSLPQIEYTPEQIEKMWWIRRVVEDMPTMVIAVLCWLMVVLVAFLASLTESYRTVSELEKSNKKALDEYYRAQDKA